MSLELAATVDDRGLDVEISVAAGRTLAVIGPNGAGKSTILAVAAGMLRPDAGRVVLDGRPLTLTDPVEKSSGERAVWVPPHDRHVTLLAQDPLLFPHLSVQDNVEFAPRSAGVARAEAARATAYWLEQVGVRDLAARKPSQISGGQAQRVAVARALAADPQLLLLDEPMAALDVAVAPALRQTLRRVLADRTVLLVTHDALDALLLADEVAVVEGGRVVEHGPTADVLARPRSAFAARIAGLNMVVGRWDGEGLRGRDGSRIHGYVAGPPPTEGQDVVAVFRPSAVSVYSEPVSGSPRNRLAATLSEIEPHGDRIRLRAGDLSADVTPRAVADLDLVPGTQVTFTVKATEVDLYAG